MKKNPLKIPCSGGYIPKNHCKIPHLWVYAKKLPQNTPISKQNRGILRQFFYIDTHHQLNCYLKHELLNIACQILHTNHLFFISDPYSTIKYCISSYFNRLPSMISGGSNARATSLRSSLAMSVRFKSA